MFGNREDDVEVLDRQQFFLPAFQPLQPVITLTLWTVAVAARVVSDANVIALAAFFDMAAQYGRAAGFDSAHHAQWLTREAVLRPVSFAMFVENVSQPD